MKGKKEKAQGTAKKKKKMRDWPLPHCTKAAAPEHSRSSDDDEPCNDARGTVIKDHKKD